MELSTFGAILTFAAAWETESARFYESCARCGDVGPCASLAAGARKRAARVERARREGVSEMILIPITGLDGGNYRLDTEPTTSAAERRVHAEALEGARQRFYDDAAAVMPIREVATVLARLARENERNLAALRQR